MSDCVHGSVRVRSWLWERTRQLGFLAWLGLAQPMISGSQPAASYGKEEGFYVWIWTHVILYILEKTAAQRLLDHPYSGAAETKPPSTLGQGQLTTLIRSFLSPRPLWFPLTCCPGLRPKPQHLSLLASSRNTQISQRVPMCSPWCWPLSPQDPEAPEAELRDCCTSCCICCCLS